MSKKTKSCSNIVAAILMMVLAVQECLVTIFTYITNSYSHGASRLGGIFINTVGLIARILIIACLFKRIETKKFSIGPFLLAVCKLLNFLLAVGLMIDEYSFEILIKPYYILYSVYNVITMIPPIFLGILVIVVFDSKGIKSKSNIVFYLPAIIAAVIVLFECVYGPIYYINLLGKYESISNIIFALLRGKIPMFVETAAFFFIGRWIEVTSKNMNSIKSANCFVKE